MCIWFFGGGEIFAPVVAFCLPCYYKLSAVRSTRARRVSTAGVGKWAKRKEKGKGKKGQVGGGEWGFPSHSPISPSMVLV